MRVLTVRQSWAWAIVHGGKDVENRSRNLAGDYRGLVAIHAGLQFDSDGLTAVRRQLGPVVSWQPGDYDLGAIVGVVDLVDVHSPFPGEGGVRGDTCSPWAEPERWHLVLASPRPLREPLAYRGALGLRKVPADVIASIEAGLA